MSRDRATDWMIQGLNPDSKEIDIFSLASTLALGPA